MSHDLAPSAQCYLLKNKDVNVGFIAILHFPHPSNSKLKRISRVVIKPEWQGIGIGIKFMNAVSEIYSKDGYKVNILTGLQGFIQGLHRSKTWICTRYGRISKNKNVSFQKTDSLNRITATFSYKPSRF